MIKVSVIIPVYGVEKYIERCARSLFEQSLDNIEFIFIDDCTQDHSIEILKSIIKEYRLRIAEKNYKVRIERMPTNSGLPAVRRHGIQLATGDYIIHCDSDDWVDCDIYRVLYNNAVENKADITYCDYYLSDGVNHTYLSQAGLHGLLQGPLWNRLVKASLYHNNILFPTANKAEDSALMMQLSFFSSNNHYVEEPLYYYFYNPNSICRVQDKESILRNYQEEVQNTNIVISFLKSHHAENVYKADIIKRKSFARDCLLPIINEEGIYKLWLNTYKEINYQFIFCNGLTIRNKLGFIKKFLTPIVSILKSITTTRTS